MSLADKLTEIANAIRKVKGTTSKMKPDTFASEINKMAYIDNGSVIGVVNSMTGQTVNPTTTDITITGNKYLSGDIVVAGDTNLKPENIIKGRGSGNYIFGVRGTADTLVDIAYEKPIWTGAYANEVVKVARTYWDARISNKVTYTYSGGDTIFEGKLTDANGNCYIDCSTFIGLVLLGIDYNHSPYYGKTGQANLTIDQSTIVPRTDYNFTIPSLMNQSTNNFTNGRIRYASDLAEYFYCSGKVIPIDEVMPGDLTFHASKNSDGTYTINNRFKNISHVGIVAEENYITRGADGKVAGFEFYNVTSYTGVCIRTKSSSRSDLVFCCRPDYRPKEAISEVSNINLIPNSYFGGGIGDTVLNGMTFNITDDGTIATTGQPTASTTFQLTSKSYPIYLKKGTYQLNGCPLRTDVTSGMTWGISIKGTDNTQIAWDLGNGATFEITDSFKAVYIYIYVSSTKDSTGYIWNPNLIRTL